MLGQAIVDRVFQGDVHSKADVIASHNRHNQQVQGELSSERLLVYDVKQGWEPLCAFLSVSVPEEPFPRTNLWRERIGAMLKA